MAEHWEVLIKFPDGRIQKQNVKSKGMGQDPETMARHYLSKRWFQNCTITARFLGTSEAHVSVGFSQKPGGPKMRLVNAKSPKRVLFNDVGQQMDENHQILVPDANGNMVVEGTLKQIASEFQKKKQLVLGPGGLIDVVESSSLKLPTTTLGPDGQPAEEVVEKETDSDEEEATPSATVGPEKQ